MSDDIENFLPHDNVRLNVEPAQVALESVNGSVLLSTLHSAFPLSTGIYFRTKTKENSDYRVMLKFDGRRFFPPVGGWSGTVEYFVELGGSRYNPFPFGSYDQASKQFERSVSLVQQMINGMNGAAGKTENSRVIERRKESAASEEEWGREREQSEMQQKHQQENGTLNKRWQSSSSADLNRCSDRDFADLARICAGKDAIIEGLRTELDGMRMKVGRLEEMERHFTEREAEWKIRLETGETELALLRELGRDQQGQRRRVEELERILNETRTEFEKRVAQLEEKWTKSRKEANELRDRNEQNSFTLKEMSAQLAKCQREKATLAKKALILEEQVNGEAMEFDRRFRERERIQHELLEDNGRLYKIKDQLEKEGNDLNEQIKKCETEAEGTVTKLKTENERLTDQIEDKKRQMIEFEAKVGKAQRERDEAVEELRKLRTHSQQQQGDQKPLFSYQQE